MKKQKVMIIVVCLIIILLITTSIMQLNNGKEIQTNASAISNKKIGWGLKREKEHKRPDLGKENQELLQKYDGYGIGNETSNKIYLTFDEGYEAGYTEKILDTLKEKQVTATFFITAHYLNTNEDLVKRMIEEGHIVGNHTPK